jgi:thiol-disulfide isomerase/thioredoxin
MRRREVLAGLGSLAVLGGAGAASLGAFNQSDGGSVEPLELDALAAAGSEPGSVTVPERGRVTFVELFATWCTVCQSMMPELAAAHESVDESVQFLSVTNEPLGRTTTESDVAEWWADHGGHWTVAADRDLELTQRLDATGVPHAVVFDEQNTVTWEHRGRTSAETITAEIRAQQ